MQRLLDEAGGEAMKLDPEKVPEALRPFLRSFQADYTRKTQAIAAEKAELAAIPADGSAPGEVAELRAKVTAMEAALGGNTTAPQTAEAFDMAGAIKATVESELGPLLSIEDMAASENPADLQRYLAQQMAIVSRTAIAEYHNSVVAERFVPIESRLQSAAQAEQQAGEAAFYASNPELAPYADTLMRPLLAAGMTVEQAGESVRQVVGAAMQQGVALGIATGKQQATAVHEARSKFSVPAASTQGRAGSPTVTPDMSFEAIGQAAYEASRS
jgi:hypothetical protein